MLINIFGNVAHAAQADFDAAVASATALQAEIAPTIFSYLQTTTGRALLISVILALASLGIAWISGAIRPRRKKR